MNPTLPADAPDPSVVRGADGAFYSYTTQVPGLNMPVLRSEDLRTWEFAADAMPVKPAWVAKDTWAPDVVKTGDHYTMTFSGRGHDGQMRIGYATSAAPTGPFVDRGILVDATGNPGFNIDSQILQDGDRTYLYWGSADGSAAHPGLKGQEIKVQPDGSIERLGEPVVAKPKLPQDRTLVEAPWVEEHDGQYYMFYSDGHYLGKDSMTDYALNVARSDSPLGPFIDSRRVISSGGEFHGPGHNSVVEDDAGQDWTLYHARVGSSDGPRQLMMDKLEWVDGWPVVAGGTPSAGPQTPPVIKGAK